MHHTPFAGLTELDEGDPTLVDGASFFTINPGLIDHFLRIGAVTHRHDGHAALASPTAPPSASAVASAGSIPADTDLFVGYTLTDSDGGETTLSEVATVSTSPPLPGPSGVISASADYSAGGLPVGTYYYGITLVDDSGGETPIGAATQITREPGNASAQVLLAGLAAELDPPDGPTGWRLWRAQGGSEFELIASGATDTFTDTGFNCTDCTAQPPSGVGTTQGQNSVLVALPDTTQEPAIASASSIRLYLSPAGSFGNPCFYQEFPTASAGATITITSLVVTIGAPPSVSTAIGGANRIDPTTDIVPAASGVWVDLGVPTGGGGGGGTGDRTLFPSAGVTWPPASGYAYRFLDANGDPIVELYTQEPPGGDLSSVQVRLAFVNDGADYPIAGSAGIVLPQQAGSENPTTWGTDWAAYASGDGVNFWPDLSLNVHFEGQAAKASGTAPVAGEVIFSLPDTYNNIEPSKPYYPVVTGDADGLQLGIVTVEWNGTNYDVVWQSGKSTDPATKVPFVALDGIVVRMNP